MSPGPRSRLRKENVDGVIVVSFTDTKLVAEDQIQEVGDELYALVDDSAKKKIVGARQLVRQDGGRIVHIAGPTRCKLPRCAHQLASAYKRSSSTSATSSTVPRPCWVNW